MTCKALIIQVVVCASIVTVTLGVCPAASLSLDFGYRQMYNLEFQGAHNTFHDWERQNPTDPLGPASDAAAYLF